jgi:hypothetical protein
MNFGVVFCRAIVGSEIGNAERGVFGSLGGLWN